MLSWATAVIYCLLATAECLSTQPENRCSPGDDVMFCLIGLISFVYMYEYCNLLVGILVLLRVSRD